MSVLLETAFGDITIDLNVQEAPEHCRNILKLAKARYYTQSLIHRVDVPHGVAYFGCPYGNGQGGASIYGYLDARRRGTAVEESRQRFLRSSHTGGSEATAAGTSHDETTTTAVNQQQRKGRLFAVCLHGVADTIGSQLALTLTDDDQRNLNQSHVGETSASIARPVLLGTVVEDDNGALDKLAATYVDEQQRPFVDTRIHKCRVVYDPFEDPLGLEELMEQRGIVFDDAETEKEDVESHRPGNHPDQPTTSNENTGAPSTRRIIDSPSPERPETETVPLRLSANEVVLDDEDDAAAAAKRYQQELEMRRKEDKSRTVMLELLGDLPPAEMISDTAAPVPIVPPESVLFVCRLNPVTTAEDLELIFSRFDENVRVDLIRDEQTLQSLQYAFVHFRNAQQATEAYLKMNKALVDDRRIVVDFCQSVSHVWDKYRQRLRTQPLGASRANGAGAAGTTMRRGDYDFSNYSRGPRQQGRRDDRRGNEHRYQPRGRPEEGRERGGTVSSHAERRGNDSERAWKYPMESDEFGRQRRDPRGWHGERRYDDEGDHQHRNDRRRTSDDELHPYRDTNRRGRHHSDHDHRNDRGDRYQGHQQPRIDERSRCDTMRRDGDRSSRNDEERASITRRDSLDNQRRSRYSRYDSSDGEDSRKRGRRRHGSESDSGKEDKSREARQRHRRESGRNEEVSRRKERRSQRSARDEKSYSSDEEGSRRKRKKRHRHDDESHESERRRRRKKHKNKKKRERREKRHRNHRDRASDSESDSQSDDRDRGHRS